MNIKDIAHTHVVDAMLLKSDRSVRSVEPGTDHNTGLGESEKPMVSGTSKQLFRIGTNRSEPVEPMTILENQLVQIFALKNPNFHFPF
jgi:hypothetical protein